MDQIRFLVQDHAGEADRRAPQPGAVALQPQRDRAPREQHGEKHKPRLVYGIAAVKNTGGRDGERQGGPSRRRPAEPSREQEKDRDGQQAGQDRGKAQRQEIAPEQFLGQKDGVEMPGPVKIIRRVNECPRLAQAVGEPSVHALVEMRGFQIERDEAQAGGQQHDGDEVPRRATDCGGERHKTA